MSNKELSVLQRAKDEGRVTFIHEPYPVMVISDALPEDLYQRLSDEYPSPKECFRLDDKDHTIMNPNTRYQINTDKLLNDPGVTPLWKEFARYHTSRAFFLEVLDLFEEDIRKKHPNLERDMGRQMRTWTTGIRRRTLKDDLVMDCQPGINSPTIQKSSVKGPHVDNKIELYAGLLYMRKPGDDSKGGALEIYSHPTGKYKLERHPIWGKNTVIDAQLKRIHSVPYQKNCFAFFVNSFDSLHGVSDRFPTLHCRRLVNIIGEIPNHSKKGLW